MNFDNIELAAAELRNEPWVTPVSMNADPAVRAYLSAATPTRVHELVQIVKRQAVDNARLVLELAAETQRADMLMEEGQRMAGIIKAQQGGGELPQDERAAFEAHFGAQGFDMLTETDKNGEHYALNTVRAYRIGWDARAALAQRAASVPAQAGAIYQVRGIAGKATPAPWHDVSLSAFQEKNRMGCEVRIVHAAAVPAASVQPAVPSLNVATWNAVEQLDATAQPDIGRDAALEQQNAANAVAVHPNLAADFALQVEYIERLEAGLRDNGCEIATDEEGNVWVRNTRAEKAEAIKATAADTADLDAQLRKEVATMYQLLGDGEWAEQIATTPHGQCLETAITRLIGTATQAAPEVASVQPVAVPSNVKRYYFDPYGMRERPDGDWVQYSSVAAPSAPEVASVPDAGEWMAWDEVGFEIFPAAGGSQIGRTLSMQDAERIVAAHNASIRQKPAPAVLSDAQIANMAYEQFGIVADDSEVVRFVRAVLAATNK